MLKEQNIKSSFKDLYERTREAVFHTKENHVKDSICQYVSKAHILNGIISLPVYDRENGMVEIAAFAGMGGYGSFLLTKDGAFWGDDEHTPIKNPQHIEKCQELREIVIKFDKQLGEQLAELPPVTSYGCAKKRLFVHSEDTSSPEKQKTKEAIIAEVDGSHTLLFLKGFYSFPEYDPKHGRVEIAARYHGQEFSFLFTPDGAYLYEYDELKPISENGEIKVSQKLIGILERHDPRFVGKLAVLAS